MRRALFGTLCLLAAVGVAIAACGGGDDDVVLGPAPDSGSDVSVGTSSGTSGTSGAPNDGGLPSENTDLPSNPRQVSCGESVCDAGGGGGPGGGSGANVCCQAVNVADTRCARQTQCDNQGNNGRLAMACDETADCNRGDDDDDDVCCYANSAFGGGGGGPTFTASCRSPSQCLRRALDGGTPVQVPRPRLCKTNAECGDAGTCNEKTCDGFKLRVCGSPDGCR